MIAKTNIRVLAQLQDDDGNRLTLNLIDVSQPGEKCYDFHSLIWDVADGSTWNPKAIITKEDLNDGHTYRWVSDIHSLNPECGSAIIQIAEGEWEISYSWREWDLRGNKQLRIIKVCRYPSDRLDENTA
jgi:hypothetical protein